MALILCPACQRQISDKARSCPHCHAAMGSTVATAAKPSPSGVTVVPKQPTAAQRQSEAFLRLAVVAILLIAAVGFGAYWFLSSGNRDASQPISGITFVDFDSKFSTQSRLTDLQKGDEIAKMKGKRVRWEGIVAQVSENAVSFKHKASTLTHDVYLRMLSKETAKLRDLHTGDLVTYEGTIDDYGELMSHDLRSGRIVSSRAISAGDQLIFLANTEKAVLERIGGSNP